MVERLSERQLVPLVVFGILIAVMLIRPTGLLGTPALQKV